MSVLAQVDRAPAAPLAVAHPVHHPSPPDLGRTLELPVLELHARLNERTAQLVAAVGRIEQLTGEPAALPDGVFTLRRMRALEDVLDRARAYLRTSSEADRRALIEACDTAGRQP